MKMINTNLLNRFWQKGVQPILDEVGKKLGVSQLVNNGLCNIPGKNPLDAAYGKTLQDQIDEINSKLNEQNADMDNITGLHGILMQPGLDIYDCDQLPIGYCGYTYSNTLNAPEAYVLVQCFGVNNNFKMQIAAGHDTFWHRIQFGGTWQNWIRIG